MCSSDNVLKGKVGPCLKAQIVKTQLQTFKLQYKQRKIVGRTKEKMKKAKTKLDTEMFPFRYSDTNEE